MGRGFLIGWLVASCSTTDGGADPEPSTPTNPSTAPTEPTDPTTAETTRAYPAPVSISQTCAATDNALRFTCRVEVDPPQPVQISYARADGVGVTRTHASELATETHDVPIYFVSPNIDYIMTATATTWPDGLSTQDVVHTGTPPASVGSWLETSGTSTMGLIGSNLPCGQDAVAAVYDTGTGDLVWYQSLDPDGLSSLNDMVRFTRDGTVMGETGSSIVEYDLMGVQLTQLQFGVDYFDAFHHDIDKLGGTVYALAQYFPNPDDQSYYADAVVLLDANGGGEIARFLPHEHFEFPPSAMGDYLHTNTITVDDVGDIYLSWLTQTSLVKVNGQWDTPDFGERIWLIEGTDGDMQGTLRVDWSQVDGEDWFSVEHSLSLRKDGRIVVLDNANGRALSISLDVAEGRAAVDGAYPTVESSCGPQGTAQETEGGNVIAACFGSSVREYDAVTGDKLWEAEVKCRQPGWYGAVRWYPLDGWN